MNRRNFVVATRFVLMILMIVWAVSPGSAQAPAAAQRKAPQHQQKTITDAAGRVHVRSARITYAERKAAAERRVKALRKAALLKKQAEVRK